ncbi:hypothetical protein E3U43_002486 [Larimichthys crocea]|uniref:Uncharacterized protein n=1 Tax=Larimichthys crocea TaxID=215358 RepID=A0ACD3QRY5_LARCR|nr:hypothetical protein E3U43_002486 [Larimichthys crocea]
MDSTVKNKLLTNEKAAKPTVPPPPPRVQTVSPSLPPFNSTKGFMLCFGKKKKRKKKKKCSSILSVAYISCHGTVSESLYAKKVDDELKTKRLFLGGTLCWTVEDGPASNKL